MSFVQENIRCNEWNISNSVWAKIIATYSNDLRYALDSSICHGFQELLLSSPPYMSSEAICLRLNILADK